MWVWGVRAMPGCVEGEEEVVRRLGGEFGSCGRGGVGAHAFVMATAMLSSILANPSIPSCFGLSTSSPVSVPAAGVDPQ